VGAVGFDIAADGRGRAGGVTERAGELWYVRLLHKVGKANGPDNETMIWRGKQQAERQNRGSRQRDRTEAVLRLVAVVRDGL
jgi:hypothetical protein